MKKRGKILSFLAAAALLTSMAMQPAVSSAASSAAQMEYLDRGTVAVDTGSGVYLSWRLLGTENYDTEYDIYRDGGYVATVSNSTNYTDPKGTKTSTYQVVQKGGAVPEVVGMGTPVWENQYVTIPLDRPEGGVSLDGDEYTYSPNDVTPADVDGDGQYELILKWEPSNSFDSGKEAHHNGNVYIDCYELSGEKLWRIDMGININAGAHFTQIAAYDFDLDGKAELAMKTAPGTKDGKGNYVTNASSVKKIKNWSDEYNLSDFRFKQIGSYTWETGGRVLAGEEYYTVFQGDTGEALDTVYYPHPRGTVEEWGDDWGNRSERYLAGVAYLDGKTPSMLAWRGYYAKTTVTAYNLVDKKLVQVADFDTSEDGNGQLAGNGNHNLTVGDVDGDGCDEVICGSLALDNDLSVLWCSGRGHGDALHLADYDPTHDGLEYFSVHEDHGGSKITGSTTGTNGQQHLGGMTLYKAESGEELFHVDSNSDQGRGMMANVGYDDGYFELWGAGNYVSYGGTDVQKSSYNPDSANQRVFWDGDVYDELFDGTGGNNNGSDVKISDDTGRVQSLRNVITNNGTKNNAGLIADILGDWREEIVMRGQDDASLVVYTTTIPTEHKLYTLMHDRAYRMQVAAQNAGYNQPPHISYYINEENDKYDARKTAAYVKTVHDGVTEVRTDYTPEPVAPFTVEAFDGQITITNKLGAKTEAVIYTARYANGALERVTKKDITIPASGYKGETDAQVGDEVFIWNMNQQPLTDKLTVKPAPPTTAPTIAPTPTPTPTASPAASPTTAPTPTPTTAPTPKPEFVVEDGVLIEYNGDDTVVSVPQQTESGETITAIGSDTFYQNMEIERVILPDSVTEIQSEAFRGCTALTSVELPETIEKIGSHAFFCCELLESIDLPENLTRIEDNTFDSCLSLQYVKMPTRLESIGTRAFYNCWLETLNLPESVTEVGGEAFADNINLKSVTIPEGLKTLGDSMFSECRKLTDVTLPEGLETIAYGAFSDCDALESITLPSTVTEIGYGAFGGSGLKTFDSVNVKKIGGGAFRVCRDLINVTLREDLAEIGEEAFFWARNLSKLTVYNRELYDNLPDLNASSELVYYGYKGSGAELFALSKKIPFYDIETDDRVIKEWVIDQNGVINAYYGSETGTLDIPSEIDSVPVTAIGYETFIDCQMENVNIPSGVTSIGLRAFAGCVNLKEITIPENVNEISDAAFAECDALGRVSLPAGVKRIGMNVFGGCGSLHEINLDSVEEIGYIAFTNCTGLTEITLGENLNTVAIDAFKGCTGLKNVIVKNRSASLNRGFIPVNEGMRMTGYRDSSAHIYATENNIPFYNIETGEYLDPLIEVW